MVNIDFSDPKQFSDFVERLEAGQTSEEEEKAFEQAIDSMSEELQLISKIALENKKK